MNCKPGDMALIVSSVIGENVGLLVDVIGAPDEEICLAGEPGQIWHCKARGTIAYASVTGVRIVTSEGPIPDRCLHPIRGRGNWEKSTTARDDLVTPETQQTVAV